MNEFFDREQFASQIRESIEKELHSFSSYWNPGNGSIGCAFLFLSTTMLCVAFFILIQSPPLMKNDWIAESDKKLFQISDIFFHLKTPDDSMDLFFTSEEATQIMRNFLRNHITLGDIRFSQDGIEGRFLFKKPMSLFFKITILPILEENEIDFQLVHISIGKLPLPSQISEIALKYFFRDTLEKWNIAIAQNIEIDSIELSENSLILKNVSLPYVIY